MSTKYTEVPDNLDKLSPFFVTESTECFDCIENADLVVFYDTCALQHHACLSELKQIKICNYLNNNKAVVVITTCVLMELSGEQHHIHKCIEDYLRVLSENGIKVLQIKEELVFNFLSNVYQTTSRINELLRYAVRVFNIPASTVRDTVTNDSQLMELIGNKQISHKSDLCKIFFEKVRANKQPSDNLGEHLIGICLYMLMFLPAEPKGKFSVFTDDKGAAKDIYRAENLIPANESDKRPSIYSSIKLFQQMYDFNIINSEIELKEFIETIYPDNVVVLALMEKTDLFANEYRFIGFELAALIVKKGTIKITF